MLQALKKFFIDDPIARTKKVYFWLFNYIGMRFSILYVPFYYFYILRPLKADQDGRVGMMEAVSIITRGCNLRCEFCNTFSPYQKGFVAADELIASWVEWRKKIKPQYFNLSGGEPFLHPELGRIVLECTRIWNESKIWLTTNGLLLERAKPEVLQAFKETRCEIIVTEHTFDPEHRKKLDAGYARLKNEGIPFVVRPSRSTWYAMYRYDTSGDLAPYQCDPKKSWNHCMFRSCYTILGDQMFRCQHLYCVHQLLHDKAIPAESWKAALTYRPLPLQSTPEEIIAHLRQRDIPACGICTDKTIIVPSCQLPVRKG